ncbi:hypothetical protein M0R45_008934 [Rubus argutus]|uniref:Uncharacterized protein n=1 Tax=Rubus argutus TaxID=59490 RepID=A0AAW1Y6H4_RUBAR
MADVGLLLGGGDAQVWVPAAARDLIEHGDGVLRMVRPDVGLGIPAWAHGDCRGICIFVVMRHRLGDGHGHGWADLSFSSLIW